jgi:DNA-directed RNA polymerase subunit beta'
VGGSERWVIAEHKGDLHPQIVIEDDRGQSLAFYYIPEKAHLEVREGQIVSAGTMLAKTPREVSGTQDITGGLPRVTEIFEARRPREPAVMAEVAGVVRLGDKRRGKRSILIQPVDDKGKSIGEEREHLVPHGKHLRVHTGDYVREGDPLVDGPLVPHDILRISGAEAVQNYLVREVQSVYRSQRVDIDDKHIEIIVSQMLRKVKVETMGDTGLLPGSVIDKFAFREVNDRLKECVKIKDPGDSKFEIVKIITKEVYEEERNRLEADDRKPPSFVPPTPATCSTQLLGITKAAVQSDSFISAASFQETTKVLTEAALAGKVDYLVGLKENVILGHLVPAGTGFHMHQEAEVRINLPLGEETAEDLLGQAPVETADTSE